MAIRESISEATDGHSDRTFDRPLDDAPYYYPDAPYYYPDVTLDHSSNHNHVYADESGYNPRRPGAERGPRHHPFSADERRHVHCDGGRGQAKFRQVPRPAAEVRLIISTSPRPILRLSPSPRRSHRRFSLSLGTYIQLLLASGVDRNAVRVTPTRPRISNLRVRHLQRVRTRQRRQENSGHSFARKLR